MVLIVSEFMSISGNKTAATIIQNNPESIHGFFLASHFCVILKLPFPITLLENHWEMQMDKRLSSSCVNWKE